MTFYRWSKTSSSNDGADPTVNWAEGQPPSSVNDSARAMMAATAKYRDDTAGSLVTGGTSTAYTLTTNQVFASLANLDGQELSFYAHAANGASPTLNVDGLGAKALVIDGNAVALPAGAFAPGGNYTVVFTNAGSAFRVKNFHRAIAAGAVTTSAIADDAVTLAKIQDIANNRLLGNASGGAASPSEIALGGGLGFVGGALVAATNPSELAGYLSGLELSTVGSSSTMTIATGAANDVAYGGIMALGTAISKTTASWVVGSTNGGLDTGSIAINTWYHFFLIKRPDTGVVDVLFSLSATSPTMPTNYTLKRRIGSGLTNGSSQWTSFTQVNDQFIWATPVADVSSGTVNTGSRTLTALTVPSGISVEAMFRATAAPGTPMRIIITSPLEADVAPSNSAVDLFPSPSPTPASVTQSLRRYVNTSRQVGVRSDTSGSATLWITTYGWVDTRGK